MLEAFGNYNYLTTSIFTAIIALHFVYLLIRNQREKTTAPWRARTPLWLCAIIEAILWVIGSFIMGAGLVMMELPKKGGTGIAMIGFIPIGFVALVTLIVLWALTIPYYEITSNAVVVRNFFGLKRSLELSEIGGYLYTRTLRSSHSDNGTTRYRLEDSLEIHTKEGKRFMRVRIYRSPTKNYLGPLMMVRAEEGRWLAVKNPMDRQLMKHMTRRGTLEYLLENSYRDDF
ncbi:hypothetical protein [Rothia aeria]|uniref:hypothetical protein n=1 Tax=Rothia aeria TaxID=172042 RepID=UPI00288059C4|nr:hypothetical protein [Rothia aeria]